MIATAEREVGAVHVLFNNAGVMLMDDDDAVNTPEECIDKTLAINVKGVLNGCKFGVPAMRRAGGGSVINTASFVAHMGGSQPSGGIHCKQGGSAGPHP